MGTTSTGVHDVLRHGVHYLVERDTWVKGVNATFSESLLKK